MEHDAEIGKKQEKRSRINAALRRRSSESASSKLLSIECPPWIIAFS
jgi:hypothetical protein